MRHGTCSARALALFTAIQLAWVMEPSSAWSQTAPQPFASSDVPPQTPPVPPDATVWVHIAGADGAYLEIERTDDGPWQRACQAPCDVLEPLSANYRVAGRGILPSSVFRLHGQQGDRVTVAVSGGSTAWLVLGIVSTTVAVPMVVVGAVLLLVGSFGGAAVAGHSTSGPDLQGGNVATVGWVTALAGAGLGVAGVIAIVHNATTGIAIDVAGAQTPREKGDAHAPLPTWREASGAEHAVPAAAVGALWTGRF